MSSLPDHSDVPIPAELVAARNMVRRMEAAMATAHGADTPAYWRAMSDRLHAYLAGGAPADEASRRAYGWLVRVAAAYRALAGTSVGC